MTANPIRNALTIDVEDYFQVSAFAGNITPSEWGQRSLRVEKNTDVLLELFEQKKVKATFFVLGWVAERCPSIARRIVDQGHEVASHGYSHQLVYNQNPETFREETERSKKLLEDQTGTPVIGYRAASYSITNKSLWALDILAELGFHYDSSVFPIRHDRYGIPNAKREPHLLTTPNGSQLAEFPISTWKCGKLNIPVAGGGYFRLLPYSLSAHGLNSINSKDNLPFVFYLHPWEIDPEQPRINANLLSRFRHYTNLRKTYDRLSLLLDKFEFTTMHEVLNARQLLGTSA